MKNKFLLFFLIVFLAIIQGSGMAVFKHSPNLLLVSVIAATVIFGFMNVLGWVVVAGIVCDLLFFYAIGVNVVILVLSAYGTSFFSKRFHIENRGLSILSMILLILLSTVFFRILSGLADSHYVLSQIPLFLKGIQYDIILNCGAFFVFFYFFRKIGAIF